MHGPAISPRSNPDRPRIDPSTIGRAYQQAIQEPQPLAGDSRAAHQEPRSIGRRSAQHWPAIRAALAGDPVTIPRSKRPAIPQPLAAIRAPSPNDNA